MRLLVIACALAAPTLAAGAGAGWAPLSLRAESDPGKNPFGLWSQEEISQAAGRTTAIYHAERDVPSGTLQVSILTGANCGMQDCHARAALVTPRGDAVLADPIPVCQDFEGFEVRGEPLAIRACGREIDLSRLLRSRVASPAESATGAPPFVGRWASDRQCHAVDVETFTRSGMETEFGACAFDRVTPGPAGRWTIAASCPYEGTVTPATISLSVTGDRMTRRVETPGGSPGDGVLYRCGG